MDIKGLVETNEVLRHHLDSIVILEVGEVMQLWLPDPNQEYFSYLCGITTEIIMDSGKEPKEIIYIEASQISERIERVDPEWVDLFNSEPKILYGRKLYKDLRSIILQKDKGSKLEGAQLDFLESLERRDQLLVDVAEENARLLINLVRVASELDITKQFDLNQDVFAFLESEPAFQGEWIKKLGTAFSDIGSNLESFTDQLNYSNVLLENFLKIITEYLRAGNENQLQSSLIITYYLLEFAIKDNQRKEVLRDKILVLVEDKKVLLSQEFYDKFKNLILS